MFGTFVSNVVNLAWLSWQREILQLFAMVAFSMLFQSVQFGLRQGMSLHAISNTLTYMAYTCMYTCIYVYMRVCMWYTLHI